eukprot:1158723-Pelagomonas_calceolata.AAC.4
MFQQTAEEEWGSWIIQVTVRKNLKDYTETCQCSACKTQQLESCGHGAAGVPGGHVFLCGCPHHASGGSGVHVCIMVG